MSEDVGGAQGVQIWGFLAMVGQITDAHRKARDLYVDRLAPDYNVFNFIEPNELRLSKILAWFLDPAQSHGQGSRFLRLFLENLGVNTSAGDWNHPDVRTEFPIPGGRLDILVKTAKFQLAIENKPWAGDQDTQLTRYFASLDAPGVPEHRLVYLTAKGTPPPEHSISEQDRERRITKRQLHLWSYDKEILEWLAKCHAQCRADRVSIFIDEFSRYIRAVFQGVRDRAMTDHLLDEIVRSPGKVSSAMKIIALADAIRQRALAKLYEQLRSKLPNHKVELRDDPWARYSGFLIDYSEQSPYKFGLEFQNTQFNGLMFGICRKEQNSQARGDEYNSFFKSFGEGSQNDWWLWCHSASPSDPLLPVSRDWHASEEPWIEIADGGLASKIVLAFKRTHEVLTDCGVG